jgi:hypothetical protein
MANRLTVVAAALIAVLAFVAAGCGGSSPNASSTSSTATSTTSRAAAAAAFRDCLAQQGVKLPSGFGNGGPPQGGAGQAPPAGGQPSFSAKQRKAFSACQSKLPAGSAGGFPRGRFRNNPALTKYTNCLRKHGVKLGGSNNQSAFKKASAACAKYAPASGN